MPSIALPVSLRGQLLYGVKVFVPPSTFTPADLFTSTEVGLWLDPSDTTTLFQDTLGITPVTATGQSVRLALDKSKGLALGTELLTNGDFASGTTGWTTIQGGGTTAVVSGELEVTGNNTANFVNVLQTNVAVSIGKLYRLQVTARRGTTTANVGIYTTGSLAADTLFTTSTTAQTLTAYFTSAASTVSIGLRLLASSGNVTGTAYFDNVSLREVFGNHLYQNSAALAPTYQIDGAGKHYLNFDGTDDFLATDASLLVDPASLATPGPNLVSNGDFATSLTGWTTTGNWTYDATNNRAVITTAAASALEQAISLTPGRVYAVTYTYTRSAGTITPRFTGGTIVSGTVRSSPAGPVTVTDYLVAVTGNTALNFLANSAFLGSVDNVSVRDVTYQTAQVFAGLRKDADPTFAVVVETSASASTTNGTLAVSAPFSTATAATFGFTARNTAQFDTRLSGFPAPVTSVLSGVYNLGAATHGDAIQVLANNSAASVSTSGVYTQGGGFTPQRVFVGRRNGSSSPFTGRIYGLVLRFGPTPSAQTISDMNNWMNDKTGAY